ncbi:MAG: CpsD/CapB family tyrosine-protein kinase [Myxococcota bacterium]|nr:CpsD/CapB family tyrosine-protein kinase [Myxococcota bacterium]
MGEIAEALRRQREEHEERVAAEPHPQTPIFPAAPNAPAPAPMPVRDTSVSDALAANAAENLAPSPELKSEAAPVILSQSALDGIGQVELHRHLALQVTSQLETRSAQTLAVVSALRDEGKTTVAATLALALASLTSNRSVALVDLDLRNPSIARRLEITAEAGIESFLLGRSDLEGIRIPINSPLLDIYPSIEPQPSAHELLARPSLTALIDELRSRYQTIVIDTPPTLIVPDASMLLKRIDGCVAVARAGVSRTRRIQEMLDILPPDSLYGKILNSARIPSRDKYYYEYGYQAEADSDQAAPTSNPSPADSPASSG